MFIPVLQQLSTTETIWLMVLLGIQLGAVLLILCRIEAQDNSQSTSNPPKDDLACVPRAEESTDERLARTTRSL
ncbi:hypothetical protein D3C87_1672820 [compost metagenome]